MNNKIKITMSHCKGINLAMQQNHVPIIKQLLIENLTSESLKDITVRISLEPSFAKEWSREIASLAPGQPLLLDVINIKLSPDMLYSLTEITLGSININVTSKDELFSEVTEEVTFLACDQWTGTLMMPEIISAFITPNHPSIINVTKNAGLLLKKWTGSPSFTGYQSNDPNMVKKQLAALYGALLTEGICYCLPPASFEAMGQRVRLSNNVLAQKIGTCLDLSLLYASCMEAVGLHPLIIFTKGHAFAGCWLEENSFAEVIQEDCSLLTKRMAEGVNEICVMEATAFVSGSKLSFDMAVELAERKLSSSEDFEFFVDVKRARGSGIRPIPQRIEAAAANSIATTLQGSSEAELTSLAPKSIDIIDKIQPSEHIDFTRQQLWERKLLDLSLRNTLLNFRVTKNSLQLLTNSLDELEDALTDGDEFQICKRPKDFENSLRESKIYELENHQPIIEELVKSEFKSKRIRTYLEEGELASKILALYRSAKVSLEENGANTLYLAMGFLKWYESDISQKPRYAPLVLLPVDIVRKSAQKGYVIRIRDEEPQINITLLEMLRADFGLTIGGLDPLPTDERGINLKLIFAMLRQAVMDKSRWDVEELAFLGIFSFSQFIMWNDIRNRSEDLKRNKIVASLISGKMEWIPSEDFPQREELDDLTSPDKIAIPMSADSSQLSAIYAAGLENSFILHGPPGTGKSQTITNMIANALFQGKSVLFIAEKQAALSVVQKRLSSIGLSPFCLELHSNKAKKRTVLSQLEQTLAIGRLKHPEEYSSQAERLRNLRRELNSILKLIHKRQPYGFSLYEAITRAEEYKDYKDTIPFSRDQIEKLTPSQLTTWKDLVGSIKAAAINCGGISNNPLKEFKNKTYSQSLRAQINDLLTVYKENLKAVLDSSKAISQDLSLEPPTSYEGLKALSTLSSLIVEIEYMPLGLLESPELKLIKDRVSMVSIYGRRRDELEASLLKLFTKDVLSFDYATAKRQWLEAEQSWFLQRLISHRGTIKSLKAIALNPKSYKKEETLSYLEILEEYRENVLRIQQEDAFFSQLYGSIWNEGKPSFHAIEVLYQQALEINGAVDCLVKNSKEKEALKATLKEKVFEDMHLYKISLGDELKKLCNSFITLDSQEAKLSAMAEIDFNMLHKTVSYTKEIPERINLWISSLEGLRDWCSYLKLKEAALSSNLGNVIIALEQGIASEKQLSELFYRNLYQSCALYIVEDNTELSSFNGAVFEEEIRKYKEAAEGFERLTRKELVARLSAAVPTSSANYSASSEIGVLQKAIKSGGRMMSIRRLFDNIPNLLRSLCPCMLMSPISVAQYIDPKFPPFDLVIFDEASQLPTCEAVGAIARGNNLIVVGDPKQLPPTSFFTTNRIDEDNYDQEDLESILDDCLALSMPQEHLLWHYRSRHESLIAFSNSCYYDNTLYTFPSPNDLYRAVKLMPVDGYYDRGRTKKNYAEAKAVVAEILRRLKDPMLSAMSIGVVTFSLVQQNLIDDMLMEEFANNPELDELNSKSSEPIFIKNLENVQGDERDVILFSVGYGPDEKGNVALNFGPLNREGGWRRLNVAVTRARREMLVFSVLKPEQIDLSKTTSEGVAGLKAFLEYATYGKARLAARESSAVSSSEGVELTIANEIRKLGYEVHTNVGCSQYKMDIAIINPEKPEEYILGIMCDGESYKAAGTARDRNILQPSVLSSLGWKIHRLWLLDWWENPSKELVKIKEALGEAINQEPVQPDKEESCSITEYEKEEPINSDMRLTIPKYKAAVLPSYYSGAEVFLSSEANSLIVKLLSTVIEAEAPISRTLLYKRVLNSFNISKLGARLERKLDTLTSGLQLKKTLCQGEIFYWKDSTDIQSYCEFRIPEDSEERRDFSNIPIEEIASAISFIVKEQFSLETTDLVKEVYKIFGFTKASKNIEERIMLSLDLAIEQHWAIQDGSRVTLTK